MKYRYLLLQNLSQKPILPYTDFSGQLKSEAAVV